MTAWLVGLLTLIGLALGGALPLALGAIRDGRSAIWELRAGAGARAGLELAVAGSWLTGSLAVPTGGTLSLGLVTLGAGTQVTVTARRLGGELWLLQARAEIRGAGGSTLAASEQGLLGRLVQPAAGAIPRFVAVSRPWFWRPP